MAVASVDIQVDGRGALQQLKAINAQSQQLQANSNAAITSLKNQSNQFNSLASGIRNLAAAYIGLQTAQRAVQVGIQREESGRRLQFLAKGYNEIAAAQEAAARSGRTFGLSTTEANQQFAQLYGRLRPLGVSLSDIESTFVGFNTTAKISGASASEASNAMTQLAQALGAGALRGDELNSVMEQAPGLVTALAKELDVPIGQIRKLASEGKLTSDVVIKALKSAGTDGADQLAAAMSGPAQAVKNLQNAVEDLQVAASKDLLPSIINTINGLTRLLQTVAGLPQPIKNFIGTLAGLALGMYAVHKAIQATIAIRATYVAAITAMATSTAATGTAATASSNAFALYTRNTQALAAQATASTGQITALGAALRSLAAIGIITIGIQLIVSQVQDIATTAADVERMRRERAAGGMTREFGGAGATQAQRNRARKTIEQINAELQDLNAPVAAVQALGRGDIGGATQNYLRGVGITTRQIFSGRINPALGTIQDAQRRAQLEERRLRAKAILAMPERQDPLQQALRGLTGGLTTGGTTTGGGAAGGKGKADDAAKATAEEQKRVADIIRNRMAEAELIRVKSTAQDKIAQAEAAGDKQLAIRLQGQLKAIDLQYQYAQQLAQEKDIRAQTAIIYEGNTALVANQFETQRQLNEAQRQADQDRFNALQAVIEKQYQMNTAVQQQLQFADSVANSIGQGMTSAFDALIRGSDDWGKSLQSIASGVLVDIANQLIKIYVIEQAINAIKTFLTPFAAGTPMGAGGGQVGRFGTFGPNYGIPQFANGGSIKANQLSLVGERGPELFMPGRSGTIIPNHNLGGGGISVVVNVDASGSSVSGDQAQGKQLGLAVSAAVQAELLKQKRPGGLLA